MTAASEARLDGVDVERLERVIQPSPNWAWWAAGLFVLAATAPIVELDPLTLWRNSGNIASYLAGYFPPNFSRLPLIIQQSWITLIMAVWGTVLAVALAFPLGLLGAANAAPNALVYQLARRTMDVLRAVNEIVFALMVVVAVGLGPFSGVLALALHTTGVLGKLLSEAIEAVDPGPVEAMKATGAPRLSSISFAMLPQIWPHFVSYTLLRFESNVRSASVVGAVGAGGIGFLLWESMRSFRSQEACAILIVMVLMVVAIDTLSARIRARIV